MIRLLGLLGGLSVATDLGSGSDTDESLKRCLVAARLARHLGCDDDEVRTVVYTALLQHLGCTAFSTESARIWGNDIATTQYAFLTNWSAPTDLLRTWVPGMAEATGASKAHVLVTTATSARKMNAGPQATCEVARDAARRLGLPEPVQAGLGSVMTMWNGKGYPSIKGDQIPLATRVMHVASTAVMFTLRADAETALAQVRQRSGSSLDPDLVGAFPSTLLEGLDDEDAYQCVLDAEPDPVVLVDEQHLETTARTFGDLVDLKSTWLLGHSAAVGDLAAETASVLHLDDARSLRIAGYLHDVGRIAVSTGVWDKPGALTTSERDQVELHPYYTGRILSRAPTLQPVARLASQHHERCDGSGYHRGLNATALPLSARVLAAADRYRCLVENRPYRASASAAEAASRLEADVRAGKLDGDAVSGVLEAAGQRHGRHRQRPAGLTDRQVEVLQLVASGLTNPAIAQRLGISSRTAERHVQDTYLKIGVSTRAQAALFAMEHGLVDQVG